VEGLTFYVERLTSWKGSASLGAWLLREGLKMDKKLRRSIIFISLLEVRNG
jgi:hypothetical protein